MQTKRVPYTFTRSGYFYFSRRVPTDLVNHYRYQRVVQALNTKMPSVAKTRAQMLSAKLDAHWSHMRLGVPPLNWSTNWDRIIPFQEDQRWLERETNPKRSC